MAFSLPSLKGNVRLALATVLVGVAVMSAVSVSAAQFQGQQGFRRGNNENSVRPFDVDPNPCGPRAGHRGGQGEGQGCNFQRNLPRGNEGSHHPGSNAFGLQFNYGE